MNRLLAGSAPLVLAVAGCSPGGPGHSVETRFVDAREVELLPATSRFVSVRDLAFDGESIWVLDGAPPFITRVSVRDGGSDQFGGEGQGPGEFLTPWAIQPADGPVDGSIRVWDQGNDRVSTFDPRGNLLGSERLSEDGRIRARTDLRDVSYADPFRVRSTGAELVVGHFPGRIDRTADLMTGSLQRADVRLEPGPELTRFVDHMTKSASGLREWAAVPFWDVCEGAVVLWSPVSAEVVWLDLLGEVRARTPVEEKPAPVSLEDIETYLSWMARLELGPDYEDARIDYSSMAKSNRDRFAERAPIATDLRCQSGTEAWLRQFDTSSDPLGRGQTWLQISANGTRRRVRFPDGFTPALFTEEGAFGVLEVPEGFQRLAWWKEESAI